MNREERRELQKRLGKLKHKNESAVMDVLEVLGGKVDSVILDGDRVTLNVEQITDRKDYPRMTEKYRQFVEESRGKVFTARQYRAQPDRFSSLIELDGVEDWLFWNGDLIKVKESRSEEAG